MRAPDSAHRTVIQRQKLDLNPLIPCIVAVVMVAPIANRGTNIQKIIRNYFSLKLKW